MTGGRRAVIVEDDFLIVEFLRDVCEEAGVEIVGTAHDAPAAIATISETRPDYILLDVRIDGGGDGVAVAMEISDLLPDVRIIYITGSNEVRTIERINADHPFRILIKPIDPADLRLALA